MTSKEAILEILSKLNGHNLKRYNFISFAQEFVNNSSFAFNTKKIYQTTINALTTYATKKRKTIDFESIDLDFYDDYTKYLWAKGLGDNTVGTHIKNIKTIMNAAFERELHNNLKYKRKGFVVLRKDADSVYLTESEIEKLLMLDVGNDTRLERVRDVFCFNCWIGLRYSDLIRIIKDKVVEEDGMTLLKIETVKTNEVVRIPINPKARPILTKYNYNIPFVSSQKFNKYLKEVAEKAGISNEVESTTTRAGEKIRRKIPKYDLVTSHTARRSFATNLYLQGVPSQHIMAVTGHKTEKAFRAYLRLSNMDKVKEIDKHFKNQVKLKAAKVILI